MLLRPSSFWEYQRIESPLAGVSALVVIFDPLIEYEPSPRPPVRPQVSPQGTELQFEDGFCRNASQIQLHPEVGAFIVARDPRRRRAPRTSA